MDEETLNQDNDSDSSEDLPALVYRESVFDKNNLKLDEVVWAEYKGLHWPALAKRVDKKNKKVSVAYCDSPKNCFKLPFKKINNFRDPQFFAVACKAANSTIHAVKHKAYVERAEMLLSRRVFGHNDDPVEFFDLSKPYFVNLLFKSLENSSTFGKTSTENQIGKLPENPHHKLDKSSNDQVEEESKSENSTESDEADCNSKTDIVYQEEECPYGTEMVNKIVSYIKDGHVNKYLMKVADSKIKSERHDLYIEATTKNQMTLLWNSPPDIPINDNKKLHELTVYLRGLYGQKKRKKIRLIDEYIVNVWLPEAIQKAIALIEEASKLPIDSSSNVSNSLNNHAHSSSNVSNSQNNHASDKIIPSIDLEAEELSVASEINLSSSSKRKLNLHPTLAENANSTLHEVEAFISSKKKRKGYRKALNSVKKPAVKKINEKKKIESSKSSKVINSLLSS